MHKMDALMFPRTLQPSCSMLPHHILRLGLQACRSVHVSSDLFMYSMRSFALLTPLGLSSV